MKIISKRIALLFVVTLIFGGCKTPGFTNRQEETKTFAIDFRKYGDKGFLFMPDKYYGEYEVRGMIRAELHPSVTYKEGYMPRSDSYTSQSFLLNDQRFNIITSNVDVDSLLEYIYNLSIEWGGDAFTHLETKTEIGKTDDHPMATYSYLVISGVVIKRK